MVPSRIQSRFANVIAFQDDLVEYLSRERLRTDREGDDYRLQIPGHCPLAWHPPLKKRFFSRRSPTAIYHEESATLVFNYLLRRFHPQIFFDIGAAQGYFTRVAASCLDRPPIVHAFEM